MQAPAPRYEPVLMNFFGFLRRTPPIRTKAELADFIDEQAAFIVQKGMYEYSRARAGPHAKKMIYEDEFHKRVNESRWRAYPLGLIMLAEMADGILSPHAEGDRRAALDPLIALVLGVFDRYARPEELDAETWVQLRADLALRLEQISTHAPKRVIDIPEPYAAKYFNLMPIHESMRSPDASTSRNFLKLNLVHIRDELEKRMDAAAMARALRPG